MSELNPCLNRLPQKEREYIQQKSDEFQKKGIDPKNADIRAIREFQEEVLDNLHEAYRKIGVEGYEEPISSIKEKQNEKTSQERSQENGNKENGPGNQEGKINGEESHGQVLIDKDAEEKSASLLGEKKRPYENMVEKINERVAKAKEQGLEEKAKFEEGRKKTMEDNIKLVDKFGLDSNDIVSKLREEGRLETRNCA